MESQPDQSIDPRIIHFTDPRVADPRGSHELAAAEFHRARNRILTECRRFGTIGPMEEFPLDDPGGESNWKASSTQNPDFFVVDDQLNWERYIYIEVSPSSFTIEWARAILGALEDLRGWGVAITNIRSGYLILLRDTILLNGPTFDGRATLPSVVEAARANLL